MPHGCKATCLGTKSQAAFHRTAFQNLGSVQSSPSAGAQAALRGSAQAPTLVDGERADEPGGLEVGGPSPAWGIKEISSRLACRGCGGLSQILGKELLLEREDTQQREANVCKRLEGQAPDGALVFGDRSSRGRGLRA